MMMVEVRSPLPLWQFGPDHLGQPLLDLIGQPAPDPHDQGKVWVFSLGRGKGVGRPVLMCPFTITRIGVMANGVQPMRPVGCNARLARRGAWGLAPALGQSSPGEPFHGI